MSTPSDSSLQGVVPDLATPEQRRAALDQAFDYRGDVTITTTDGRVLEGYVFDRRSEGDDPYVRLMPRDASEKVVVRYADIARLQFSGRDPAAGRSWETWVKNYVEKKLKGEVAELKPEALD